MTSFVALGKRSNLSGSVVCYWFGNYLKTEGLPTITAQLVSLQSGRGPWGRLISAHVDEGGETAFGMARSHGGRVVAG